MKRRKMLSLEEKVHLTKWQRKLEKGIASFEDYHEALYRIYGV